MLVAMEEDGGGCADFFRMSILLAGVGQSQLGREACRIQCTAAAAVLHISSHDPLA